MVGGDLYWFWKPYELYGMVDYVRAPVSSGFFSNHGIIMHLGLRHPSLGGWRWLRQCRRHVPSLVEIFDSAHQFSAILNLLETFANVGPVPNAFFLLRPCIDRLLGRHTRLRDASRSDRWIHRCNGHARENTPLQLKSIFLQRMCSRT
jgi:hypothetical protein